MNFNPEGGLTAIGFTIPLILLFGSLVLLIASVRRVLRSTDGTTQVLWLAFVVFTLPIGAIISLFALPSHRKKSN